MIAIRPTRLWLNGKHLQVRILPPMVERSAERIDNRLRRSLLELRW